MHEYTPIVDEIRERAIAGGLEEYRRRTGDTPGEARAALGAEFDRWLARLWPSLESYFAVCEVFEDNAPVTIAVRDPRNAMYLISADEDGELFYVGVPTEADEDGSEIDRNIGWLELQRRPDDNEGPRFPLTLVGRAENL